jgi:hypothetical protein
MPHLTIGLCDYHPGMGARTAIQKAALSIVVIASVPHFLRVFESGLV